MTTPTKIRECKYNCRTVLGDFDEEAHKYKEYETGIIHTIERCQAAKERLIAVKQLEQQKNDHGNESYNPSKETLGDKPAPTATPTGTTQYVDHTAAGVPQIITVVGESAVEMDDLANSWLKRMHEHIHFRGGQRVYSDSGFEITLYYEDKKQ